MAKRIKGQEEGSAMAYEALKTSVVSLAGMKHHLDGDLIPEEVGRYWRIGQTLAWYSEVLLENLALELRRSGKSYQARDLVKMVWLYLHYPTIEKLSGRCVGQKQNINLDEFLEFRT